MATIRKNDGGRLSYTNSTGSTITAGSLVHIGNGIMGIASNDIANGDTGILEIDDQTITVTKNTSAAIAAGAKVYLIGTTSVVSGATAGGTLINNWFASAAATSAATTVDLTHL